MPEEPMLKGCIEWLESTLQYDRWLLDPSTQTLVEHTAKYLKELHGIKEKKESTPEEHH